MITFFTIFYVCCDDIFTINSDYTIAMDYHIVFCKGLLYVYIFLVLF
jgi:hypothetical protein